MNQVGRAMDGEGTKATREGFTDSPVHPVERRWPGPPPDHSGHVDSGHVDPADDAGFLDDEKPFDEAPVRPGGDIGDGAD